MSEMRHRVVNFGCRLNSFESGQIDHILTRAGRDDLIVVNSCAVTNETERQVRQKVRQLVRQNPGRSVAVVGCAAELNPESFRAIEGVSLVLGNQEKLNPAQYGVEGRGTTGTAQKLNLKDYAVRADRTRAEVMIQNGCDHDCTFCAITLARGGSRSVPVDQVVEYIRRLVNRGVIEVVLTGVDLTSYGADLEAGTSLGGLVQTILTEVPTVERLRLSSLDCLELDEALIEAMTSESRLMPHVHLSLQSGDDLILKRMKRRHDRSSAIALCQRLKRGRPEMVFGADLIAGFPTETERQFARTVDLVEACDLTWLHVFPFSARRGTPAARIPKQVPVVERRRRAGLLRQAGEARRARFLAGLVGSEQVVLPEGDGMGRTAHFAPVYFDHPPATRGLVRTRITGLIGDRLQGKILDSLSGAGR